jgi:hypothetical protein
MLRNKNTNILEELSASSFTTEKMRHMCRFVKIANLIVNKYAQSSYSSVIDEFLDEAPHWEDGAIDLHCFFLGLQIYN